MDYNPLRKFTIFFCAVSLSFCQSTPSLQIPSFDYRTVSEQYFRSDLQGHFVFSRGDEANLDPVSSRSSHLFYTAGVDGSGDIWMRDLQSTNAISIISHPAEQYDPAINAEGSMLAFVSEDRDYEGDLRLLRLKPQELSSRSLKSISVTNLWGDTTNLSLAIEKWSKKNLLARCHGRFAEKEPDFNAKGDQLVFVSDRCTPGKPNIWLTFLDGEELLILKRLTDIGGQKPRWNSAGDKLTFLSYRQPEKGGRIYVLDLSSQPYRQIEVNLPRGEGQQYYYNHPDFVSYENILVYTSARQDSNKDGLINAQDYSGVYTAAFSDEIKDNSLLLPLTSPERKILEASAVLHNLTYSDAGGGSLFYSADLDRGVSIYFLPYGGVIPKEKNIEKQYQLTERYLKENQKRYLLSLDAVKYYFSSQPHYILYEPKLLIDRLLYLQNKRENKRAKRLEADLKRQATSKPYLKFYYDLNNYDKIDKNNENTLPYVLSFYQRYSSKSKLIDKNFSLLSKEQQVSILSAALHRLALEYVKRQSYEQALTSVYFLNVSYPNYIYRGEALVLQADLEFRLHKRFSSGFASAFFQAKAEAIEKMHDKIYQLYVKNPSQELKQRLKKEIEKIDSSYHPLFTSTLRLAWAYYLLQDNKNREALTLCSSLRTKVPQIRSSFSSRPKEGWRAFYVQNWLLIQQSYKALGDRQAAFASLGEIIINYSKVDIDSDIFYELIEYSKQQIEDYLELAQSLSISYKKYNIVTGKTNKSSYRSYIPGMDTAVFGFDLIFKNKEKKVIELNGSQAEALLHLCRQETRNTFIFRRLGKEKKDNYLKFCRQNANELRFAAKTKLPLLAAYNAIDNLYALSYAGAKMLNSLFLVMRRSGFLPEVYKKESIYFQRLEVDIATQQNQRLFENISENRYLKLIIGDVDLYNARAFSQIEEAYRSSFGEAVAVRDISFIYGYAYALIQKNTKREAFYKRLQESGQNFSINFWRARKWEIVQGLKDAETLLQYALSIDALHVDSNLLLGWLHQYIDETKKSKVRYKASFIGSLAGAGYETEIDGTFYKDIYQIYFPDQYFEKNVELYQQVLEGSKSSGLSLSPTAKARLHLNLANNYFALLNFSDAIKNYRKTIDIFSYQGQAEFEDPKQEVLFYFNFARALIYTEKYQEAISYLKRSYELYKHGEYLPLQKQYNGLRFSQQNLSTISAAPPTKKQRQDKRYLQHLLELTQKKLRQARSRLALLSATVGFAYWQDAKPKQAVLYYTRADQYIGDKKEKKNGLPQNLNRANLLNFMAIAHQETAQLALSDEKARIAEEKAREGGLSRAEGRYQPKTYCGRSLGCFLNFGEDFSVIGKGRNPYGFSRLRQAELATSVQLENMIMRGQLSEASQLIKKQRALFRDEDGDVKHGRIGYLAQSKSFSSS